MTSLTPGLRIWLWTVPPARSHQDGVRGSRPAHAHLHHLTVQSCQVSASISQSCPRALWVLLPRPRRPSQQTLLGPGDPSWGTSDGQVKSVGSKPRDEITGRAEAGTDREGRDPEKRGGKEGQKRTERQREGVTGNETGQRR